MSYLVKYTVYFVQQDMKVSDELEVNNGDIFYDFEENKELNIKDEESAKKYIKSIYSENEDNLVIIPQSVWDSDDGLTDTELTIDSIEII